MNFFSKYQIGCFFDSKTGFLTKKMKKIRQSVYRKKIIVYLPSLKMRIMEGEKSALL